LAGTISTISLPSWLGSRRRLRPRVAMLVIWHDERRSETRPSAAAGGVRLRVPLCRCLQKNVERTRRHVSAWPNP
jgi:hypothetical protein